MIITAVYCEGNFSTMKLTSMAFDAIKSFILCFYGKHVNFEINRNGLTQLNESLWKPSLSLRHQFATLIFAMPKLTSEQRAVAYGMIEAGRSCRDVARVFGVHHSTLSRNRIRYRETGRFVDRPRSGRPRVTIERQDRYIRLSHLRRRFHPASKTAAVTIGTHGRPISPDTVERRLKDHGLTARRPFRGPVLSARNRQNRLAWAYQHLRWTRQRWGSVLFTDELIPILLFGI